MATEKAPARIIGRICAAGHERISYRGELCPLCVTESEREKLLDQLQQLENDYRNLAEKS
jgi:hypothetical protein